MNRAQALQVLTRAKPELAQRFGVVRLALITSVVSSRSRVTVAFPNWVSPFLQITQIILASSFCIPAPIPQSLARRP